MKFYFVIKVLTLSYVYARLSLMDLKDILRYEIVSGDEHFRINFDGSLNFVRGYAYHHIGLVHNIRLFAPEIEAHCDVTIDEKRSAEYNRNIFTFKRMGWADKVVYHPANEEYTESYSSVYHYIFIHMFLSPSGVVSIEGSNSTLTAFLRECATKENAYQLLAALLLLSEGINVPLKVVKSNNNIKCELILEKSDQKTEVFRICMNTSIYNEETDTEEEVIQHHALQVILFFLDTKKKVDMPTTLEEFKKGEFLNSLQFLIQAYLFEFINTAEDAKTFIGIVYEMLNDYLESDLYAGIDGQNINTLTALKSCYFVQSSSVPETSLSLEAITKFNSFMEKFKVLPFLKSGQLPSPIAMSRSISPLKDCLGQNHFVDWLGISIYTLFSCLIYNPTSQMYCLSRMPNVSSEVRSFFSEHTKPSETTSPTVQKAWNKIMSNLNSNSIYLNGKTGLRIGLLKTLLLISEISGKLSTHGKKITNLMKALENVKLDNHFYNRVKQQIEQIFTEVSVNKDFKVICKGFEKKLVCDSQFDIFGTLIIEYKSNGMQQGLKLDLSNDFGPITLLSRNIDFSNDHNAALSEIENLIPREDKFINHLLIQYIENTVNGFKIAINPLELKDAVEKILKNNLDNVNKILLMKKIEDNDYKRMLLECIVSYTNEREDGDDDNHVFTRFISNILKSIPLDDCSMHIQLLNLLESCEISDDIFASSEDIENPLSTNCYNIIAR